MIAYLKRTLLNLVGLPPAPPSDQWIRQLKAVGYRTMQDRGAWRWHLPWRAISGRFTSEHSAWCDAEQHYHQRLHKEPSC